jgi:hypothetical protein
MALLMNYPAPVKLVRSNPRPEEKTARKGPIPEEMLKCSYRPEDADFYCWRFKIWYNSLDCAYRTRHRSFEGCARCNQGDFNLKSRGRDLQITRYLGGKKP